ncbi:MAG TPA: FlgO family outer membrane protein [Thermoanaerobaculia bacterium]|nr:FlgO family outer membrane protein [Thermoanaerobaculia bacterium]
MRPIAWRAVPAALALLFAVPLCATAQKVLADGIRDLATQIAGKVAKEQKHRIAVLPFKELEGQPTVLGTYLAEELVTDLFENPGLSIVERTMLDRIVGELKLDQSGLIDPETAKRVGKIAGVDAIVTGTITDLASYVAVNARLIDAQSGRIFAAAQTRIVKDDDVRKIMAAPMTGRAEAGESQPGGGGGGKQKRDGPAKARLQREENGFIFDLRGCRMAGTTLDCDLMISSRGEDRDLTLYFSCSSVSRFIDESGNEYVASSGSLATDGGCQAHSRLVSGVSVKARISFVHLRPEIQEAKLLELHAYAGGGSFLVQFRDVAILRP